MSAQHALGPELGSDPITYTCWCGFRHTDYNEIHRHIDKERAIAHEPRHLTTIPAADIGYPAGLEVAATPHGDEHDAVEIRMIVRVSMGDYRRQMVLVRRTDIPFWIETLEAHRLDKDADPCAACAAQAFIARLTKDASTTEHTCSQQKKTP